MSEIGICKGVRDEDLIAFLEPLCNFSITTQILSNPSTGFLHAVFKCFLKDLQISVDGVEMMPWNEDEEAIEYREMYQDVSLPIFFVIMKRFMTTAGVLDFSIKDILEPKPKRTRKILIYLLTFWKHTLTMLKKFEDVELDLQEEIKEEQQILFANEELNQKYEELRAKKINPEKRQELLNLRQSKNFDEISRAKDSVCNQYQVLKADIANENQKSSELDVNIVSEKEKIEDISSRILKSPDRLTSDVDTIKQKINDEDDKLIEMTKKKEEKKQDIEAFKICIENSAKFCETCNEVFESVETLKKEALGIDEKQGMIENKTHELKAAEAELDKLQQSIATCEQKRAQADLQIKMQIEGQKKILEVNQWGLGKESALTRQLQETATIANKDLLDCQEKYDKVCSEIKVRENELKDNLLQKKKEYDDYIQSYVYNVNLAKEIIKEANF